MAHLRPGEDSVSSIPSLRPGGRRFLAGAKRGEWAAGTYSPRPVGGRQGGEQKTRPSIPSSTVSGGRLVWVMSLTCLEHAPVGAPRSLCSGLPVCCALCRRELVALESGCPA